MRELKFRVWNIQDKCWDNPSILEVWNDSGKLEPYSFIKTGKLNPLYIPIENYVIQQFTGLLDKNGKEIYEGDIVEETTSKGPNLPERFKNYVLKDNEKHKIQKIQWGKYADGGYSDSVECWMFGEDNSLSELISRTKGSYHEWVREYEVIGNIFENPELLEKAK